MAQEANQLEFLAQYTIAEFKEAVGSKTIKIQKNRESGKLSFSYGPLRDQRGAVSGTEVPNDPVISRVKGDQGEFYLLHSKGNGGLEDIASL